MLLYHLIKGCTATWLKLSVLSCCEHTRALGNVEVLTPAGFQKSWTHLSIWKILLKEVPARIWQNQIPGPVDSSSSSSFPNRERRVKILFQSIDSTFWEVPQRVAGRGFNPISGSAISTWVTTEMTAASQNFGFLANKRRMELHFLYLLNTQWHPHPHIT